MTKRETESFWIAVDNNAMGINYTNATTWKMKTQQNRIYSLCLDRGKTFNHIISKWNKLTQKEYMSE